MGHEPHPIISISKLLIEQSSTIQLDKIGMTLIEGKKLNDLEMSLIISPAFHEIINS